MPQANLAHTSVTFLLKSMVYAVKSGEKDTDRECELWWLTLMEQYYMACIVVWDSQILKFYKILQNRIVSILLLQKIKLRIRYIKKLVHIY
jgi:hypothetical protein